MGRPAGQQLRQGRKRVPGQQGPAARKMMGIFWGCCDMLRRSQRRASEAALARAAYSKAGEALPRGDRACKPVCRQPVTLCGLARVGCWLSNLHIDSPCTSLLPRARAQHARMGLAPRPRPLRGAAGPGDARFDGQGFRRTAGVEQVVLNCRAVLHLAFGLRRKTSARQAGLVSRAQAS